MITERVAVWAVVAGILLAGSGFVLGLAGLPAIVAVPMFYGGLAASKVGVVRLCLK